MAQVRRAPKTLEVYRPETPFSNSPDAVVSYEEGRHYVKIGLADSCKHGRAIRMRIRKTLPAGSAYCSKEFVLKKTGKWYWEPDSPEPAESSTEAAVA